MRKLVVVIALLVWSPMVVHAQATTFILIRHAEKANDGTKDPELSEVGRTRALALAKLLKNTKVDAIYATGFKRTQATVALLAMSKQLMVLPYEPMKGEAIDEMASKFQGGTIVVCGHSNTTPWTANYLLGKEQHNDFEDSDYANILIVNVIEKGNAKVTWLTY